MGLISSNAVLNRGPLKDHLAASAVCVRNQNQDNLVICRKLYLNFNGLKGAAPSKIALCNLQLVAMFYGTDHYLGQVMYFPRNFTSIGID